MGVKWKTKTNKLPKMSKMIETIGDKKVQVGALEGDHAWLAGIHEY